MSDKPTIADLLAADPRDPGALRASRCSASTPISSSPGRTPPRDSQGSLRTCAHAPAAARTTTESWPPLASSVLQVEAPERRTRLAQPPPARPQTTAVSRRRRS